MRHAASVVADPLRLRVIFDQEISDVFPFTRVALENGCAGDWSITSLGEVMLLVAVVPNVDTGDIFLL